MPFVFCNFFHEDDSLTLGFQPDNIIYGPTPCQRLHYSLLQKCVTNSAKGHNTHLKIKGLLPIFSTHTGTTHGWGEKRVWFLWSHDLPPMVKITYNESKKSLRNCFFPCNCVFAYYSNQTRMFEHREVKKCVYELKPIWPWLSTCVAT